MIKIGITGDIGSGKSFIANQFGYPVFNADKEVKKIYKNNRNCFIKLKKKLPKFIKSYPIKKKDLKKAVLGNKNNLKKNIYPSEIDYHLKDSYKLLTISNEFTNSFIEESVYESLFIVGMLRSGSTLVESILSMNKSVYALGESNILEESYLEQKVAGQGINIAELYFRKVSNQKIKVNTIINKLLYNYKYLHLLLYYLHLRWQVN